jgi:hypothetical protein
MKTNVYDRLLSRLSKDIIPQVIEQVTKILLEELNEHLQQTLLPTLTQEINNLAAQHAQSISKNLPKTRIEELVVESLTKRIDDLYIAKTLPNQLTRSHVYLPNSIVSSSVSGEYLRASNPLARDFFHPEFEMFCEKYFDKSLLGLLGRKTWEWAFIYHRLSRSGVLGPGLRGLGFGVGVEKLPAIFASMGVEITATDAPDDVNGWRQDGAYCGSLEGLYHPDVISRESFDKLVHYESCDMNNVSGDLTDYDFCWSSCALEHLGSIQHGINFIINSIENTLKIGGVACHTTELNLSSDVDTLETAHCVLYRKQDLERLCATIEERGHWVEPLRIEPGDLPPDYLVDVPPYSCNPHLKLLVGSYVTTSVGIVARRGR